MENVAVLVDGAFFIKRALHIFGPLDPEVLADKLHYYACLHTRNHGSKDSQNSSTRMTIDYTGFSSTIVPLCRIRYIILFLRSRLIWQNPSEAFGGFRYMKLSVKREKLRSALGALMISM